jgi:sigma-B regulation protein RsbU (phosphoserine phosphatase)
MNNKKTKVLVVDDDAFIREVLASILEGGGYDVGTAENGKQALAAFSADGAGVDLIISDMNMPEMNGTELIKKIRDAGSDVPIIILTGNSEISVAISAMNSGASDYLMKDENIQDTVILSVEKVLEKHELKKHNIRLMKDLALENERLEREKVLAQKVQRSLMPGSLLFEGLELSAFYRPSDKIGGDFFDAWEANGRVHFMIGDVSGHSTSSALLMAVSKGILHSLGHTMHSPAEIVQTANRMVCGIVGDSGMFLSLLYGVYDRAAGELSIVSAGHNPVFLADKGAVEAIHATGAVMGWDTDDKWDTNRLAFACGASLMLYTDGLTEAKDDAGQEFGEERLMSLLNDPSPPELMVEKIFKKVEEFNAGAFADDLTMLIIRRKG